MCVFVVEGFQATRSIGTTRDHDVAVKLNHVPAACPLMQRIHVLRHDQDLLAKRKACFPFS
jgi:hypothetical protein